jgi:biopolymer transport protein ExbB/biopolymer transport protein TolQ
MTPFVDDCSPWQGSDCGWTFGYLWLSMDRFGHATVALLALLLLNAVVIIIDRFYCHGAARRQSRIFVRESAVAVREGKLSEVIALAAGHKRSHLATLVAAGFTAFTSVPQFTDEQAIDAAGRALQRSHKMIAAGLRQGLGTLSTIASSATFIGLLGTVFGILNAFRGVDMAKSAVLSMQAWYLAEALLTTAMGLLVAVPAVWCRDYLLRRMEVFESEMSNAALEAITYLSAHRQCRSQPELAVGSPPVLLGSPYLYNGCFEEAPYDRQQALLLAMCGCALYGAYILVSAMYQSYSWKQSDYATPSWEEVGGQELISPDHGFRAVVPRAYLYRTNSAAAEGTAEGSCLIPVVALRIIPNGRPLSWKPYACGKDIKYELEQDRALLTWSCGVPTIMSWRTNDELLIQCSDCSSDNLELVKLDSYPGKVTVLDTNGKRIHLQVVYPQLDCSD